MSIFVPAPSERKYSPAADRILSAAGKLFYEKGIQAVGIDQVIKEANVALNTMYKYFPSKNKLVEEYLLRRDARWLYWFTSFVKNASTDPKERLLAIFDAMEQWFTSGEFRGCAFINAAGEMGTESESIAQIAVTHKKNVYDFTRQLVSDAGFSKSDTLAQQLMLLLEGAIINAQFEINSDSARCARQTAKLLLCQAKS